MTHALQVVRLDVLEDLHTTALRALEPYTSEKCLDRPPDVEVVLAAVWRACQELALAVDIAADIRRDLILNGKSDDSVNT